MDKRELDRAEMMFVTGMLTRGTFGVDQTGDDDSASEDIAGAIKALRNGWQDGWADRYADALSAPEPPAPQAPAPQPQGMAYKPAPTADLSDFSQWANEPLGMGKKDCETYAKPWSLVTYEEISRLQPSASQDLGYLKWIAGPKFEAKWPKQKAMKARVVALIAQIEAGQSTPF